MELIKVAEIILKKIKTEYKDDVAVMCLYGSYVYNENHKKSDLDFYYIPKTNRGYELAKTFIINDIGFDFFPISWERAEDISNFREMNVPLICDAQVIYYGSDDDLKKFEALRTKAKSGEKDLTDKKNELIKKSKVLLSEIALGERSKYKKSNTVAFINCVVELLYVANKSYIRRGYSISIDECENLNIKPENVKEKLQNLLFESEAKALFEGCVDLLREIEHLFNYKNEETYNIAENLAGFYEEAKSHYNKIYYACDLNNPTTVLMASDSLQTDLIHCMGEKWYFMHLPEIVESFDKGNLVKFKEVVELHENQFRKILSENNVHICEYMNIGEFEKDYL